MSKSEIDLDDYAKAVDREHLENYYAIYNILGSSNLDRVVSDVRQILKENIELHKELDIYIELIDKVLER